MAAAELVEVWRGPVLESVHRGHAAVWHATGGLVEAWGDADALILPRSACKMVQALPLALADPGLAPERLALACASHAGAPAHTARVGAWLADLGLGEDALRCGAHAPGDREAAHALVREGKRPTQVHNNCSGKHAGFLQLGQRLGGGPEYVEVDHPVQRAARGHFEEATGLASPGWAVDGCSAPNFATTLAGLARAMAGFAAPGPGAAGAARARLMAAMAAHPDLVAGEGRACTDLMRAANGRTAGAVKAVVKTGAEGVFAAILPERGLGVAIKIADGAARAAEAVVAALLVRHGALDAADPVAERLSAGVQRNWRGLPVGRIATRIGAP